MVSPARSAAFDILLRIETEKAYSSVLLPMYEAGLSEADRGLCHELTLGTLRRQIYLDRVIEKFTAGKRLDMHVRIAIRLALYQLEFLDKIPAYSAINESVNLVQRAKKTSAKGFVNAVLRRALRERTEMSYIDDVERISLETSHPRWLIEKWTEALGIDEAATLAQANNEIPDTAFRTIDTLSDVAIMAVAAARKSHYADGCFIADASDHRIFDLAANYEIYIQDEASQLAALAVEIPKNGSFLDVCAAPGGKTGLIAGRYPAVGNLVAGDIHYKRIEHLRNNCLHQGFENINVVQFDAEVGLPFSDASFDSVLVDAPCSGTGTIRHNPELRYFLSPSDFAVLAAKQLSILNSASKVVCLGGQIVYSTCSLEVEENEEVCAKFLGQNGGFEKVLPAVDRSFINADGYARTWPQRDRMDGFFIAVFRRR